MYISPFIELPSLLPVIPVPRHWDPEIDSSVTRWNDIKGWTDTAQYLISFPIAKAKLLGNVQGVVVQASNLHFRLTLLNCCGFSKSSNATVTALLTFSLYALSSLVSKLDNGVSHAQ